MLTEEKDHEAENKAEADDDGQRYDRHGGKG
jgi:hypothetical protein